MALFPPSLQLPIGWNSFISFVSTDKVICAVPVLHSQVLRCGWRPVWRFYTGTLVVQALAEVHERERSKQFIILGTHCFFERRDTLRAPRFAGLQVHPRISAGALRTRFGNEQDGIEAGEQANDIWIGRVGKIVKLVRVILTIMSI